MKCVLDFYTDPGFETSFLVGIPRHLRCWCPPKTIANPDVRAVLERGSGGLLLAILNAIVIVCDSSKEAVFLAVSIFPHINPPFPGMIHSPTRLSSVGRTHSAMIAACHNNHALVVWWLLCIIYII